MDNQNYPLQGWDMVAATRQRVINQALRVYHSEGAIPQTAQFTADLGLVGKWKFDLEFGAPIVSALPPRDGFSSVYFDFLLPIVKGTFSKDGESGTVNDVTLKVQTNLSQIASKMSQSGDTVEEYQLSVNLSDDSAIFSVNIGGRKGGQDSVATLEDIFAQSLQTYLRGLAPGSYPLTTINLGQVSESAVFLIPETIQYAFQYNEKNPEWSVLYVMTNNQGGPYPFWEGLGETDFSPELVPVDQVLALSQGLFMDQVILPGVKSTLKNLAGKDCPDPALELNPSGDIELIGPYSLASCDTFESHNLLLKSFSVSIDGYGNLTVGSELKIGRFSANVSNVCKISMLGEYGSRNLGLEGPGPANDEWGASVMKDIFAGIEQELAKASLSEQHLLDLIRFTPRDYTEIQAVKAPKQVSFLLSSHFG